MRPLDPSNTIQINRVGFEIRVTPIARHDLAGLNSIDYNVKMGTTYIALYANSAILHD